LLDDQQSGEFELRREERLVVFVGKMRDLKTKVIVAAGLSAATS